MPEDRGEEPDALVGTRWHILVVDDSQVNLRVITGLLKPLFPDVVTATGAEDAALKIEERKPDLILLDIMMPVVDGLTFCKQLKEVREYADIPVIFLTAMVDKETVVQAFEAGGVDYLTKPVHPMELVQRVRNQLRIVDLMERFEQANNAMNLHLLKVMETQAELQSYQEQLLAANKTLKDMASHDALTGLLNRRRAWELISWELDKANRSGDFSSVIMVDIDFFKRVNDTYGHSEGDRILVETAQLLKAMVRAQDLVIRWGGEEFLIFLPGTDLKGAERVADKLILVARSKDWSLGQGGITLSAGLASEVQKDNFEEKVKVADACLYLAKTQGRNTWISNPQSVVPPT